MSCEKTVIVSNGSKHYGEQPEQLAVLLDLLQREPLDRRFEKFGGFIRDVYGFYTQFLGNFLNTSHVFCICTNEPEVVAALTVAIAANVKREDYASSVGSAS